MNQDKRIAGLLLEIAKNSETTFIEDAKINKEIKDVAKKIGLVLPSPDFAVFATKWADIDKKNLNDVRLPRKAVEEGIQTLVGKNLNFEHKGAYNVCGFCLSVKIKKDIIECIQVFYKSLYPDKFEELKQKIKNKEAAVSFEIWNISPKTGKSVIKELEDGTVEITEIHAHGTGLLLINPPACPDAKVFHLEAKIVKEAEQIINNVFDKNLIYASQALEEEIKDAKVECQCLKCGKVISSDKHCKDIKCPDCGGGMRRKNRPGPGQSVSETKTNSEKEVNKVEETKLLEQQSSEVQEKIEQTQVTESANEEQKTGEQVQVDKTPAITEPEAKAEEAVEEQAEAKPEEPPVVEEVAEEKVEETEAKVEENSSEEKEEATEEKSEEATEIPKEETEAKETETKAQDVEVVEPKIVVKVTRIYSEVMVDTYKDGTPSGSSEVKGYSKRVTEYSDGTKDEVEEEVEIKKKYDFAEVEAIKAEIAELKTELEKIKSEKDKEISNLKTELGKKDQEIEKLSPKKEDEDLTVGSVDVEVDDETTQRARKINEIIAAKRNQ